MFRWSNSLHISHKNSTISFLGLIFVYIHTFSSKNWFCVGYIFLKKKHPQQLGVSYVFATQLLAVALGCLLRRHDPKPWTMKLILHFWVRQQKNQRGAISSHRKKKLRVDLKKRWSCYSCYICFGFGVVVFKWEGTCCHFWVMAGV